MRWVVEIDQSQKVGLVIVDEEQHLSRPRSEDAEGGRPCLTSPPRHPGRCRWLCPAYA
jgi:hypothetical protein